MSIVKNIKLAFAFQIGENQRKYCANSRFAFRFKLLRNLKTLTAQ